MTKEKSETISFRIDSATKAKLVYIAKQEMRSLTNMIAMLIKNHHDLVVKENEKTL